MAKKNAPALPPALANAMKVKSGEKSSGSKKGSEDSGPVSSGAVSDGDFDLEAMARHEAKGEQDTDEAGPSDEGEPTDDSGEASTEASDDDEGDESTGDDPEETDGDEGDAEDGAQDEPTDEDEEPEAEGEAPADEEPETPAGMAQELALLREQNRLLMAAVYGHKNPPPQATQPDPANEVPDNVLRAALFGGDTVDWSKLPSGMKDKAAPIVERYLSEEAQFAKDPSLRYEKHLRKHVAEDIFSMISPLLEDFHARNADGITKKLLDPLKDPKLRKRAEAIYADLPGSRASTWKDREKTMRAAVASAKAEAYDKKHSEERQKNKAGKVQAKATGGGKLKGSVGGGSPKRPPKTVDEFPDMLPGETAVNFAKRIGKLIT